MTPDLILHVIAPYGSKTGDITKVLKEAEVWVAKNAIRYENSIVIGREPLCDINEISMLGKVYKICIIESAEKSPVVAVNEENICIYVNDKSNTDSITKFFETWWRDRAYELFNGILLSKFNIFESMGYSIPAITVKKMHTRWGSCNKKLCKINLNYYLYSLPEICIEYVILHELVHLIHSNHQKEFYDFLTVCMPNWKSIKKIMDEKYVLAKK